MRASSLLAASLSATFLAACSGTAPYLQQDSSGRPLATDAKVRTILQFERDTNPDPKKQKQFVICAEPSPDVAQAISTALSAGLQLDLKHASGAEANVGANLARSSSESVAELGERLATIQLLRDKMYRACEAYGNGAIGSTAYALILARHDKTMMSLLSNELAAGAFGRSLAALSSSSSVAGADAAAMKTQEADVKQKAAAVQADLDAKKDATADYKALNDSLGVLLAMDAQSITSSAAAPSSAQVALGTIVGTRLPDVQAIQEIHRNYIDDDGIDPLTDACIIGMEALDEHQGDAERKTSREALEGYRAERGRLQDQLTKAQAAYANDSSQAVLRKAEADALTLKGRRSLRGLDSEDQAQLEDATKNAQFFQGQLEIDKVAVDQALEAIKDKGDPLEDLFISRGSPFAAFCYASVLNGGSKYVQARLDQKTLLRKLDPTSNEVAAQRLDLCAKIVDKPVDSGFTADAKQKAIIAQCGPTTVAQVPAAVLSAPQNVSATSTGGSLLVKFEPPASGTPTSYSASAKSQTDESATALTGTGTASSRTITLKSCKSGDMYTVEVKALGAGGASATGQDETPVKCVAAAPKPTFLPPSEIESSSADSNIIVKFKASPSQGITGYEATATDTAKNSKEKVLSEPGDAKTLSLTIKGCTKDVVYGIAVSALDAAKSKATAKAEKTVKCDAAPAPAPAPSKPKSPEVKSVSSAKSAITVTFTAPADGGSPIIAYSATAKSATDDQTVKSLTQLVNTAKTSATILDCVVDKDYTVTVFAKNKIGDGDPSKPPVKVTCKK